MSNIINAIINLVTNPQIELMQYAEGYNRANNQGESLEECVKDLFAGTVGERDLQERNRKISEVFSYLGNQNNPPDSILRGGDTIEVKKIQSKMGNLQLNSSYPKHKLYANSNMITEACRRCEDWIEKDIIYIVGSVNNSILSNMSFVYGVDYAASDQVYLRIKDVITNGVNSIADVEFAETEELGRVNKVDPLGITYLRVRGMWGIVNPMRVFGYIYNRDDEREFNFMALINSDKYYTFNNTGELEELVGQIDGFDIVDVEIKNPDNPAQLRDAKLITFKKNKE